MIFEKIIRPIALFRISIEEFAFKRDPNHTIVEDYIANALMLLMVPMEMLGIYLIAYYSGPFHVNHFLVLAQMGLTVFLDIKFAELLLRTSSYKRKMEELYEYYNSIPKEQRMFYRSWKYRMSSVGRLFTLFWGTFILGIWLIPKIFPK